MHLGEKVLTTPGCAPRRVDLGLLKAGPQPTASGGEGPLALRKDNKTSKTKKKVTFNPIVSYSDDVLGDTLPCLRAYTRENQPVLLVNRSSLLSASRYATIAPQVGHSSALCRGLHAVTKPSHAQVSLTKLRNAVKVSKGVQTAPSTKPSQATMSIQTDKPVSLESELGTPHGKELEAVGFDCEIPSHKRWLGTVKQPNRPVTGALLCVRGTVRNMGVSCLIDSGASHNFISLSAAKALGLALVPVSNHPGVHVANGHLLPITQCCELQLNLSGFKSNLVLDVVPGLHHEIVLGLTWLSNANPLISWSDRTLQLEKPNGTRVTIVSTVGDSKPLELTPESTGEVAGAPLPTVNQPEMLTAKQLDRMLKKCPKTEVFLAFVSKSDKSPVEINFINKKLMLKGYTVPSSMKESGVEVDPSFESILESIDVPTVRDVVRAYGDRFPADLPGLPPHREGYDINIDTVEGSKPFYCPMGRYSPLQLDEMKKQIDYLLDRGLIKPSQSPYGAAVLFAPKKDGALRMCIDYRALNKQTIKTRFPLPHHDEHLAILGGNKFFSKLDLRSGYWQLRIADKDTHKTAFRTRYGQFEWLVMPFGLTGAPGYFSALVTDLLRPFLDISVIIFIDDVLVFSKTESAHCRHLQEVLQRFRDVNLFCKLSKCSFAQSGVEFLGHWVDRQGISPLHSTASAIATYPRPNNLKELQQFLGLAQWYRKFVPSYSVIAVPLTDLTRKDRPWVWSKECEKAFLTLRSALHSRPLLAHPDNKLPFVVFTDASVVGLGGVLCQGFGRGLQPITFESKKLSRSERNYTIHDLELLAVVHCLRKWHHYLEGVHFTVKTDNAAITHIFTQVSLNTRQTRWMATLQAFSFDIVHVKGLHNEVADALSRLPHPERDWPLEEPPLPTPGAGGLLGDWAVDLDDLDFAEQSRPLVRGLTADQCGDGVEFSKGLTAKSSLGLHTVSSMELSLPDSLIESFKRAQRKDSRCTELFRKVKSGAVATCKRYGIDARGLLCGLVDGACTQLYVPNDSVLKAAVLDLVHDSPLSGHKGAAPTLKLAQRYFVWPKMSKEIEAYVRECPICQRAKNRTTQGENVLTPLPIPESKWSSISMDFITCLPLTKNGHDSIFVVCDRCTKMSHFIPCNIAIGAPGVAQLFMDNIVRLHGVPASIVSDRDTRFRGLFWKSLMSNLQVSLNFTTAFRPQGDGLTERTNRTLQEALRCFCSHDQSQWDLSLALVEFQFNNSVHSATGYTPFFLNYGYHPRHPAMFFSQCESKVQSVEDFVARMAADLTAAKDRMKIAQQRMKAAWDKGKKPIEFSVGQEVLLATKDLSWKELGLSRKLRDRFIGPYCVLERIGNSAYKLDLPASFKIHPVFNVSKLKAYNSSSKFGKRAYSRPPPDLVDGVPEFEVSRIVKHRRVKGRTRTPEYEYLVDWVGYPPEDRTWLTAKDMENCLEVLADYQVAHSLV